MTRAPLRKSDVALFWSLVRRGSRDICWNWQGGCNGDGYGYFKQQRAHRLAYWLSVTKPQRCILHTCNNRLCCNPRHLYDGTHRQNMRDMMQAGTHDGRNRRGEQHPCTHLTSADVRFIRTANLSGVSLAERFFVCPATISQIRHRKRWVYE